MMAVEQREQNDQRTMGLMFHFFCDEQKGKDFYDLLELLLSILIQDMREWFTLTNRYINEFMDKFIDLLPPHFNVLKLNKVCET